MSDTEYERFEITNRDLEYEFNPTRYRRNLSKNQQIYGIWASDSDNEDVEEYDKRGRRKAESKKSKDYTAPVSFVAGGVQQYGKKKEKPGEGSTKDDDDDDDDDDNDQQAENHSSESEDEQESYNARPSFSQQPFNKPAAKGIGQWESYTKGIGAKLLLQMGYEPGKGLGKDLQGIATPVEASVRKGRGAIGAYGPEKLAKVAEKPGEHLDKSVPAEKSKKWLKNADVKKRKKLRYYYRSVEDIIEKGGKKESLFFESGNNKLGNVTVIDMTGPEKRVLSGYHALGQSKIGEETLYDHTTTKKSSNFQLPELMYNLNLIVDMSEQDIIGIEKSRKSTKDRKVICTQEKEKLKQIVELERDHINTLENALDLVENLVNPQNFLTLSDAEKIFITLLIDFPEEYKEFGLGDLAPGIVAPMFVSRLKDWKPLEEPTKNVPLLKRWHTVLNQNVTSHQSNLFDPYSALVWSGIIPSIRNATNVWDPRNYQQMIALLDAWAPLFPSWILDNILEQIILPKLTVYVVNWDPLTDTIPIHVWILPWSKLLAHKMDNVYTIVREKFGNALKAWLPSDRSARAMLLPWKDVFDDGDMQSFLIKHIIPKLQLCLSDLVINPLQQDLELWNQVWEWHELVPAVLMSQMLEKFFFPKWIQTLVIWLNQNPNLDQVSRWYTGWKNFFTDEVLQQTNVKEQLRRALELMHRATGTTPTAIETMHVPVAPPPPKLMDLQIPPPTIEFKDLVSQRCSDQGIIFVPMPGRREMGKQVYRIGKLFGYIDRSVIMVSDGSFSNWAPISITSLLERAVTG